MVRSFDDHVMNANPINGATRPRKLAYWFAFPRQRCKLVGYYSHLPRTFTLRRQPQNFGRGEMLVAWAERTGGDIARQRLFFARKRKLFGPLGPLGCNDYPLFGEAILSEFGHV